MGVSWWIGLSREDFAQAVATHAHRLRWSTEGFRVDDMRGQVPIQWHRKNAKQRENARIAATPCD